MNFLQFRHLFLELFYAKSTTWLWYSNSIATYVMDIKKKFRGIAMYLEGTIMYIKI